MVKMGMDVTSQNMVKYLESGRLGYLHEYIPDTGRISVSLQHLFKLATGYENFEYKIVKPENIEAIVLYEGSLYKHFPRPVETKKHKKYKFFGSEVTEKLIKKRPIPSNVNLAVIIKDPISVGHYGVHTPSSLFSLHGDKDYPDLFFTTTFTMVGVKLGVDGLVKAEDEYHKFGSEVSHFRKSSVKPKLNFNFISLDKLESAYLDNKKYWTEDIINHSVPLFGRERFEKISIGSLTIGETRNQLHEVVWGEDLEGKLQGDLKEINEQ